MDRVKVKFNGAAGPLTFQAASKSCGKTIAPFRRITSLEVLPLLVKLELFPLLCRRTRV